MASPKEKCDVGDTSCKKLELNKTTGVQEDDSPPGSRTPKSPQSDGSSVSDDTCPICLGHITDKCVIKTCFHNFCFVCLKEWAKQKPVCPLCKVTFKTIMHDIKAINEYKEYVVPRPEPTERSQAIANFQEFLDAERRRFFGYRTTNFPGATALRRQHPGRPQAIPDAIPSGPRERRSAARYNHRGSSIFRLSVYHNDVWVQPLADITGRYRQSGPDLYREQPALTHRLVSWVNRELAALVPSSRVGVVLVEVMELIERHPIDSRAFRRAMRPHLGIHTHHFVHEFYHFSRSPYDMVGHDNAAQYVPRFGFADDTSSSSSDDSDAVVEVDVRGNPIPTSSNNQGTADPQNIEREETLTQEGSVVISSDDTSSSESSQQSNQFMKLSVQSARQSDLTMTHNPEPPPAVCNMRRLLGRARNFLNSVNEGASTSRPEETSEASLGETGHSLKREVPSDSGDSDACIIVEEVNKIKSPPELIDLDSDESRQTLNNKSSNQFSGGKSKDGLNSNQQKQERREKCKLSLKRHNFPIAGTSSGSGSSLGRKALKEDHSYCSEHKPVKFEASTSASNSSKSMQTSSIEISLKWHNRTDNNGSVVLVRKKDNVNESKKSRSSSSDSDSSSHNVHLKKHKHRNKIKHKHISSKSKSSDRARDNTYETSSHYKGKSPMQSSSAGAKKDHRSKVKSSSRHSTLHVSHDRQSRDRQSHEIQSHDRLTRAHCYSSETSSNTVGTSDNHWTPLSTSWTERSSSREEWYPENNHNRDSSYDSRSSLHRERRGEGSGTSKSRHSCKKRKHKSKKSKKSKHKKKSKPKKIIYSSDSNSDTDSTDSTCKKLKKRKRLVESSTSDTDTTLDLKPRWKAKKIKKLSDSSSS